jgi:hypothetical protein
VRREARAEARTEAETATKAKAKAKAKAAPSHSSDDRLAGLRAGTGFELIADRDRVEPVPPLLRHLTVAIP